MENALRFSACIYVTFMGIFLKLTAFFGHTLSAKERFVFVPAEYRCLSFGLSAGYWGSTAEERKQEVRGAKLQYYQLCLLMLSMLERLEPLQ